MFVHGKVGEPCSKVHGLGWEAPHDKKKWCTQTTDDSIPWQSQAHVLSFPAAYLDALPVERSARQLRKNTCWRPHFNALAWQIKRTCIHPAVVEARLILYCRKHFSPSVLQRYVNMHMCVRCVWEGQT